MFANSRAVSSNQSGVHVDLEKVVRRHLASAWRAPIADHDLSAFEQARACSKALRSWSAIGARQADAK